MKLKPCPFCGASVEVGMENGYKVVRCGNIDCYAHFAVFKCANERVLMEMWNTRLKPKKVPTAPAV